MKLRGALCCFQLALACWCMFAVTNWGLSLALLRHETDKFVMLVFSESPKLVERFVEEQELSTPGVPPEMSLRLRFNAEVGTEGYQSGTMWGLLALGLCAIVQCVLTVTRFGGGSRGQQLKSA